MKPRPTSSTEDREVPLVTGLVESRIDQATLDLLAAWRREDATRDPEEIEAAERDLDEFKKTMNNQRAISGESAVFP
jgi:hypothetical protein